MLAKSCAASLSQNPSDNPISTIVIARSKIPRTSGETMNPSLAYRPSAKISICLANEQDREVIYKMRHDVYARELGQHLENKEGRLTDQLDAINIYLVAKVDEEIAGFVSVTPPNKIGYSIDKYFRREDLPLNFDQDLYETRILTVSEAWRSSRVAA